MQVAGFNNKKFWPGPLYQDKRKQFYRTLGKGKIVKGSWLMVHNPMSKARRLLRQLAKDGKEFNLVGDARHLGGHMVVTPAGEVLWMQQEIEYGVFPSVEQVRALIFSFCWCVGVCISLCSAYVTAF